MIYLENNQNIQDVWIPRQEVNQTAFTRYASEEYVDNAIANETARTENTYAKKTDLTAYTPTEDFATINGSAITQGGNIVIETGGNYSAGTNIQIEDDVISVTGITVPTKLSDLENDEGFITTADTQDFVTSADVKTQIEDYGYITEDALSGYSTTQEMNTAISNATSGKVDTSAMTQYYTSGETDTAISNATSGLASQSWVENKGYLTGYTETDPVFMASAASGITAQDITNWNAVTGITVPTKLSELENDEGFITSNDIPTSNTAFTNDAGYITEDALSGYSTTEEMNTAIDNATSGKADTSALNSYYTSAQTDTAISNATSGLASTTYVDNSVSGKADSSAVTADIAAATAATTGWVESQGYLTGYTETEPIFTGSPAYGITSQDITNWNSVSGKADTSRVDEIEEVAASAITDLNTRVVELSGNSVTTGTVQSMITAATEGLASETYVDNAVSGKVDTSAMTAYYTSGETDTAITNATSGLQETLVSGTNIKTINNESILGSGNITIQGGGGAAVVDYNPLQVEFQSAYSYIDYYELVNSGTTRQYKGRIAFDTINGNTIFHSDDNNKVNWTIPTSGDIQTQIENSISGKVDTTAMTQYATTGSVSSVESHIDEVEEVVASALTNLHSTKQDTLVSGTNIKTINNQSLLGSGNIDIQGGGGSYSAGTNIDITNNVISVTGITIPTSNTAFTNDAGYITEDAISGKADTTAVTQSIADATSGMSQKLDISVFESSDLAVSHAINDLESRKVASNDVRDIVKMSQNDYDSLSAKSATTLYIII